MNDNIKELKRLNFEDFLWIIFAGVCLINVYGDNLQKNYIYTNSKEIQKKSNNTFVFTLCVTFLIYIYFFIRNYNNYKDASEENKKLYTIKLLGSSLLIAGIICLIYFQKNNPNFIGSPDL